MILYIDSFFAERRERVVRPLDTLPETLTELYLMAMREHARDGVLMEWQDGRWHPMPDWRFDRHVIRIGLYLTQRLGIEPGDRVAVMSELRPEWLLADLAVLGSGAVSVAVPSSLPGAELAAALVGAEPRVAFVSAAAVGELGAVRDQIPSLEQVIALDPAPTSEGVVEFVSVLDLGGTLDTPERAQNFRFQARQIDSEQLAIRHHQTPFEYRELTHGEALEEVKRRWFEEAARKGDRVYVAGSEVTLGLRFMLYGFIGDGFSTMFLGTPGRELDEIAALHPDKLVVAPDVLARGVQGALARTSERAGGVGDWIRSTVRRIASGRTRRDQRAIREALGGRVRWIGSTAPLDHALSTRLSAVAAVGG